MYYEEIIELNKEQSEILGELSDAIKIFQQSIINGEVEKIEQAVNQKEKIINRLKFCEVKRAEAIQSTLKQFNLKHDKQGAMDDLAGVIYKNNPQLGEELNESRSVLFDKVKEVLLLNSQNEILINNSRLFIRDLIKNVLGTQKENFFDKKV